MKKTIAIIIYGFISACVLAENSALESKILKLTTECMPVPGTSIQEVSQIWPDRFFASLKVWTGKGKEWAYHKISWPNKARKGKIYITLKAEYVDGKIVSSFIQFPDLYSNGVIVDKKHIKFPFKPSKEQLMMDTYQMLLRLKKELKLREKPNKNGPPNPAERDQ